MKLETFICIYGIGDISLAERKDWFVRRKGVVKGPFLSAQVTRNILLGRLHPDDELSLDKLNWQQISEHRDLYPDVMQTTPDDKDKLEAAKVQVDERVSDQRRQKDDMAQERRLTRERRGNESEVMLLHRENRKEMNDAYKNSMKRPKLPALSILLVVIVIVLFATVLKPKNRGNTVDCSSPANAGVNWSNCHFVKLDMENQNLAAAILTDAILNESNMLGANLSGSDMAYAEMKSSDLSYANLSGVRLIGANLRQTDLRYANLENADLSYADLTGAMLAGTNMMNTQFDNAIWIDGRVCGKGSVGSCKK